jgi:hypothetical protein
MLLLISLVALGACALVLIVAVIKTVDQITGW